MTEPVTDAPPEIEPDGAALEMHDPGPRRRRRFPPRE